MLLSFLSLLVFLSFFFFFNDTATTEIYTLSLHDALPIFPAHPRTRSMLPQLGAHVRVTPPLGYLELAALASHARVILTDSGGLQKEAYWYGVPCVTLRPSTEWVDTVEVGANVLVDDDPVRLVEAVRTARMPDHRPALYGDGRASGRVAEVVARVFGR